MSYTLDEWDPDVDFDGWYTTTCGARIGERLDDMRARTVLEVGCATGLMTTRLLARNRRILAVTLNEGMAQRARERNLPNVDVVCGNVCDMRNMEFEAIIVASVLHEVISPQSILRKCHQLLAPRGTVFVTAPNAQSLHFDGKPMFGERAEKFGVLRLLTPLEWVALLIDGTGLDVAYNGEMMLKPWPNDRMACLPPAALNHLAAYRGSGGAICYFELEAAI